MRPAGALLACAAILLVAASVTEATGGEKKKGKTNAEKIIGKWEVTKADEGPVGALVEFTKDGKLKLTLKVGDKELSMEGTYKVEKDKLKTTVKAFDKEVSDIDTIKTLNETMLILEDTKGKVTELKRKKK
jgi:uncharacterized protein (TIGR03066 family)